MGPRYFNRSIAATLVLGLFVLVSAVPAAAQFSRAVSTLVAVQGQGEGRLVIAPAHTADSTFLAQITVSLRGTTPRTIFLVSRAVDFALDRVCEGTEFEDVATVRTSSGGAGAVHFVRTAPLTPGTQFEIVVRVVGTDGTTLWSNCMTVTVI
jgi:hypothetical protein